MAYTNFHHLADYYKQIRTQTMSI